MSSPRVITLTELNNHNTATDCWIAVHGKVYDVTKFLSNHPGGGEVIASLAGSETAADFEDVGHSDGARNQATELFVGVLEGVEYDGTKRIPSLSKLKKDSAVVMDTRVLIVGSLLSVLAAVVIYYVSGKKE